jgi:hypothetical protein
MRIIKRSLNKTTTELNIEYVVLELLMFHSENSLTTNSYSLES